MLLTLELLPLLLDTAAESGDGRIMFVSSGAHSSLAPSFDANKMVVSEADYRRHHSYASSKLYNVRDIILWHVTCDMSCDL